MLVILTHFFFFFYDTIPRRCKNLDSYDTRKSIKLPVIVYYENENGARNLDISCFKKKCTLETFILIYTIHKYKDNLFFHTYSLTPLHHSQISLEIEQEIGL